MKFSEYNMDISYIRGPANTLADALSRLVATAATPGETKVQCILALWPEASRAVHSLVAAHVGVCEAEGGGDTPAYRIPCDQRFAFEGEEAVMEDLATLDPDPDTQRERTLLMSTLPTAKIDITPSDYEADKDYGLLYRGLAIL